MGIPKFFRQLSERYPLCSQLIDTVPEYDYFYLDMNGLIHMCSHANTSSFKELPEIISDIFCYLDLLVSKIRPKKVLFLAVDGCAPRSKMNQQRSRRFKAAQEHQSKVDKLDEQDNTTDKAFDSNCITPGTDFMYQLHLHFQYFIQSKISNDPLWQSFNVIYSSCLVPGEGEHKIQAYIRQLKHMPEYHPNLRHCLYGLDADLIMLGLLSHEPHFSLLREEILFNVKSKSTNIYNQKFFLLHLSMLRDYLSLEFKSLQPICKSKNIPWLLESIIDDYVLICMFIGNDFLPHLPHLHLHDHCLQHLISIYITNWNGYLNDQGHLNLPLLQQFLVHASVIERDHFNKHEGHTSHTKHSKPGISPANVAVLEQIKSFLFDSNSTALPLKSTPFSSQLAHDLGLPLINHQLLMDHDLRSDTESMDAQMRVIFKYDKMPVQETTTTENSNDPFLASRTAYYVDKLEQEYSPTIHLEMASAYLIGLQWVLLYYYNGVPSWSWYYPYHYAPYIADILIFMDKGVKPHEFDLSTPYLPYSQLLSVMPIYNQYLLPNCIAKLMHHPELAPYYPLDFKVDLNGKQQDWQGIVKIPFVNEEILSRLVKEQIPNLTKEEQMLNSIETSMLFQYTNKAHDINGISTFPAITSYAKVVDIDIPVQCATLIKNTNLVVPSASFPTLQTKNHFHTVSAHSVQVFERPSKLDSVVVSIEHEEHELELQSLVGKVVYLTWPNLKLAKIVALSYDNMMVDSHGTHKMTSQEMETHETQSALINTDYSVHYALEIGPVEVVVYYQLFKQMGLNKNRLEQQFDQSVQYDALQCVLLDLEVEERFKNREYVVDYHVDDVVVYLGQNENYGRVCTVTKKNPLLVSLKPSTVTVNTPKPIRYHTAHKISHILQCSALVVSKITSHYRISYNNSFKNIGLNMKYSSRGLYVRNMTLNKDGRWLYSDELVDLLKEYKKEFPDIWNHIIGQSEDWSDLVSKSRLQEVVEWTSKHHRIATAIDLMEMEGNLMELELVIKNDKELELEIQDQSQLMVISDSHLRMQHQQFKIQDIVLIIKQGIIGEYGVVVGGNDKVDVVCNTVVQGGNTLDGRLTENKGITLEKWEMINITNRQPEGNRDVKWDRDNNKRNIEKYKQSGRQQNKKYEGNSKRREDKSYKDVTTVKKIVKPGTTLELKEIMGLEKPKKKTSKTTPKTTPKKEKKIVKKVDDVKEVTLELKGLLGLNISK